MAKPTKPSYDISDAEKGASKTPSNPFNISYNPPRVCGQWPVLPAATAACTYI